MNKTKIKITIALISSTLIITAFLGLAKVMAEQSGSSSESGLTSKIKTLYDDLSTLTFGTDTDTPDWGAYWNRIKTAAKWTPNGDATEADVANGKTFHSVNSRTLKTGSVSAGSDYGIPKTGQTTSYPNGDATDRDDGYYEKGKPTSGVHYQDNGDGTITDNATGLMWLQDPSLAGGGSYPNTWATALNTPATMTWANAIINCEALTYATYSDWRLPNIKELQSIVNYGRLSPTIGESTLESPWVNTQSGDYWSSTTYAGDASYAWGADFYNGYVVGDGKTFEYYVRCVRQ